MEGNFHQYSLFSFFLFLFFGGECSIKTEHEPGGPTVMSVRASGSKDVSPGGTLRAPAAPDAVSGRSLFGILWRQVPVLGVRLWCLRFCSSFTDFKALPHTA